MEKVLERVKRLLALAKSDNPNEAANAMAVAQKLIDEHRLSVAEIEIRTNQQKEQAEAFFDEPLITGKIIPKWKIRLASILVKHNGCEMLSRRIPGNRKLIIFGRASDVENVRFLFAWATSELQRMSKRYCNGRGRGYYNSWYHGAVSGIDAQLTKWEIERASKPVSTMALVALDNRRSEAQKLIEKLIIVKKEKIKVKTDNEAFSKGYRVGKNLNLKPEKALS
jgi:hypothetical protein